MIVKLNPNHLNFRIDRHTGSLWLTLEERGKPLRRLREVTHDVYLAFCADLISEEGTERVEREIKFAPDENNKAFVVKMTLEVLEGE